MKIAGVELGGPPGVIAEISGNHGGELGRARELIMTAKRTGAAFCKTQCYEADTITLNVNKPDFIVQSGLWKLRTLHALYSKAQTPLSWHKELYRVAHDNGIAIFSSVFDFSAVDLLESLGCPAYKIASFEIVDLPLIEYAAKTGKPLIISTGMATDGEVMDAKEAAGPRAIFLHCTSEYPATIGHAGLHRMRHLADMTGCPVGLSDHTRDPVCVPMMATGLGAVLIEKHLKLADGPKSEDDAFSLDPAQFDILVKAVKVAYDACQVRPVDHDNPSRQMRRSLYAVTEIEQGEKFTMANVRSIRPGYGLVPKKLPRLLRAKATKPYRKGDPIKETV